MKKDNKKENLEIEKLKIEIAELKSGWQRTQADFENFRNRNQSEKIELIQSANRDLIMELLPILDNFERALNHKPKELINNEYIKGLEYIKIQIENILANYNLEKIKVLIGDEFDPNIHEAISVEENSKYKENKIIEIIESGYRLNEKVIRPAKVKVAK